MYMGETHAVSLGIIYHISLEVNSDKTLLFTVYYFCEHEHFLLFLLENQCGPYCLKDAS